jgi:Uma2 family endonuclease
MTLQTTTQATRRPFSAEEYHRLYDIGVLKEDDRVELIDGEIIEMFAIGPRHAACVDKLAELLRDRINKIAIVRVQNPVHLNEYSEPGPDIALLVRRDDFYSTDHPSPKDVLIAIEVADSSLAHDREFKLPAYARAGIPEVWLVDLINSRIEIHTQPAESLFQEVRLVLRGQKVVSKTVPQLDLRIDELFG